MSGITIVVFGFKYGIPRVNNYIDVSFLQNPARSFGLTSDVTQGHRDMVRSQPLYKPLMNSLVLLSETIISAGDRPKLGIGCSAGRHRSRVIGEDLAEALRRKGHTVFLTFEDADA